jgi:hypothetical protein
MRRSRLTEGWVSAVDALARRRGLLLLCEGVTTRRRRLGGVCGRRFAWR